MNRNLKVLALVAALALTSYDGFSQENAEQNLNPRRGNAPQQAQGPQQPRGGFGGAAFTPHENVEFKNSIGPGIVPAAGTVNGTAVDREDFRQALVVCALTDIAGGTSVTINVDESVTGAGGWVAVTGATFTAFTPTRDNGVDYGSLDLRGRQQFLRLTEITAGTFASGSRNCGFLLAGATTTPVAWTITTADFNIR